MDSTVEIRSARDGVTLRLSNFFGDNGSALSDSFLVSVVGYELHAATRASSCMGPNLADYFRDIAEHWRGWKGEKKWGTLEGEFELSATADSTGHVKLRFFLRAPETGYHWELSGAIELEAGQLDSIAADVRLAWPA
jgi:Family of unknown function (DUF6228)